jgi:hypothetical protein
MIYTELEALLIDAATDALCEDQCGEGYDPRDYEDWKPTAEKATRAVLGAAIRAGYVRDEDAYGTRDDVQRLTEALYTAEQFIARVTGWDGDTPDEQTEVLAEVRRVLGDIQP